MGHSKRFKEFKEAYEKSWMTKEQLHEYAGFGIITPDEYTEITGEAYE